MGMDGRVEVVLYILLRMLRDHVLTCYEGGSLVSGRSLPVSLRGW
jgi:hypothetical protein